MSGGPNGALKGEGGRPVVVAGTVSGRGIAKRRRGIRVLEDWD